MQLYFIRHGQSVNNALWELHNNSNHFHLDPELTDLGHQQAKRLASFLNRSNLAEGGPAWDLQNQAGFMLTHLYTSPMTRAIQTAEIIAECLDLPLVAWLDLHEEGGLNLDDPASGEPVGQPGPLRSYFVQRFPSLILPEGFPEGGWWNRPWETQPQRIERAQRFAQQLFQRHPNSDDRVALVSHGGFYNRLIAFLLGLPENGAWWLPLNNTAISRIDFLPTQTHLIYHNRLDHLPPELIS
jgi:2,3-bisphosphoglycerate-dependent phosphoglycerate mutase